MIKFIGSISLSMCTASCTTFGCSHWSLQSNYAHADSFKMVVCKDLVRVDGKPFPDNLSYQKANDLLSKSDTDLSSCAVVNGSLRPYGRSPESVFEVSCNEEITTEEKIGEQYIIYGRK